MIDKRFLDFIIQYVSTPRRELFERVLSKRTNYMSIVLENIYQSQNASAVLRSCDCFGVQSVNIIENNNEYDINPDVALGSSKWLSLRRFSELENNTEEALVTLKSEGYRIVATSPHENNVTLDAFDIEKGKFALVFGTELDGISDIVKENADEFLKIPMHGFTESFNISVSAALCMHHLSGRLHQSDLNWHLTEEEKNEIKLNWARSSVRYSELIEKEYYKRLKLP